MSWRFVNAAARGTSHERTGLPCQDDCYVAVVGDFLVAIASDGAGSAACSEEGSALVCETLSYAIEEWLSHGGVIDALTREVVSEWIERGRQSIASRATQRGLASREFACTLIAAIAGPDSVAFFQIGDGAIVIGSAGSYEAVFWPTAGEYANMTFFATDDDWSQHLDFEVRRVSYDVLAVMTDGLQRLALCFGTRAVHGPFFEPMFRTLEAASPGYASDLEPSLLAFLGSDAVNARTDDDKSLVLATRRSGTADGSR